jgi:hypothetical protein
MSEVSDPLIRRFPEGWEPVDFELVTLEGLPNSEMLWRTLKLGETTRKGDYVYLQGRWHPAPESQLLRADRPRVWRPLGPGARRWYAGGSGVNCADRNGDPWKPFGSLEEALARIKLPALGVVVATSNYEELHAFDPPIWDENRGDYDPFCVSVAAC